MGWSRLSDHCRALENAQGLPVYLALLVIHLRGRTTFESDKFKYRKFSSSLINNVEVSYFRKCKKCVEKH